MFKRSGENERAVGWEVVKIVILITLCFWAFRPEISRMYSLAFTSGNFAHGIAIPIGILLLIYRRRSILAESCTEGSAWGNLLLVAGFTMYGVASWPFDFGYVRELAILPVLAGAILVAGGGKVLKLSIPMLLLTVLAIPIGSRIYAGLVVRPETYTIALTKRLLEALQGTIIWGDGMDLFFSRGATSGSIALGEANRGAALLLAYLTVGVFVTFSRIRSIRRYLIAAMAAVPIMLLCNLLRFFLWSLLVIYFPISPTSAVPRNVTGGFSLIVAYVLFALVCGIQLNFYVAPDEIEEDEERKEASDAR